MELSEAADEIRQIYEGTDAPHHSFETLVMKMGNVARGEMAKRTVKGAIEDGEFSEEELPDRAEERMNRRMFADMMMAVLGYAIENDLDMERALEDHFDLVRQRRAKDAMDNLEGMSDGIDTDLDAGDDRAFL